MTECAGCKASGTCDVHWTAVLAEIAKQQTSKTAK